MSLYCFDIIGLFMWQKALSQEKKVARIVAASLFTSQLALASKVEDHILLDSQSVRPGFVFSETAALFIESDLVVCDVDTAGVGVAGDVAVAEGVVCRSVAVVAREGGLEEGI